MTELERALTGDTAAAPPSHILEAVPDELAHRGFPGVPHTIYAELWHVTYWQQVSLDWVEDLVTPMPEHNAMSFPDAQQSAAESWQALCTRFFAGNAAAGALAARGNLERSIQCASPPGMPERSMSVADQLISLGAHNHYHFGRVVLLRQMAGAWPPPAGGYTW